jgi:hypothetical protein
MLQLIVSNETNSSRFSSGSVTTGRLQILREETDVTPHPIHLMPRLGKAMVLARNLSFGGLQLFDVGDSVGGD